MPVNRIVVLGPQYPRDTDIVCKGQLTFTNGFQRQRHTT